MVNDARRIIEMTKRPDAIFSDLDGSLLGPEKQVGEKDAAAIRRLTELGIPVIVCTGRPILGARQVMEMLNLDLAVCSNGGCCHNFREGKTLFATAMDHSVAHRLITWLAEEKVCYLLHAPDRIFASAEAIMPPHYLLRGRENGGELTPDTPLDGLQILKILAIRCDAAKILAKARKLFSPEELSVCSSEVGFVDFNPSGVNKGRGIRQLAGQMGWRMENILALGDNDNDLPMLEAVGMGAAPASGRPEVLAAADYVASPCGENPLTQAVEHYFPELLR